MKNFKQTYLVKAPLEKVWQALIDPVEIEGWGGGPAQMNGKEGTEFKLWGGDIYGKNIKVVKEKELSQDWFGGDWEEPSKVTFKLSEKGNKTQIDLIHENIPDFEAKEIEDGWKRYYLGPIKEYLERI